MVSEMHRAHLDRLQQHDQTWFSAADAIDTKASIALVVIVFLGEMSGGLMATDRIPSYLYAFQIVACALLVVAGARVLQALWIRGFLTEKTDEWETWIDELRTLYPNDETGMQYRFHNERVETLKNQIRMNRDKCNEKSDYVRASFRWATLVLGINLLTAVILGLTSS